jgi:hypothetical protein
VLTLFAFLLLVVLEVQAVLVRAVLVQVALVQVALVQVVLEVLEPHPAAAIVDALQMLNCALMHWASIYALASTVSVSTP